MKPATVKEGKTMNYATRTHLGRGKVIEVYYRVNGWWLILHDKARNKSITLRQTQVF